MNVKSWSSSGLPRFVCSWLCLCLSLLVVPSNAGGGLGAITAKVLGPKKLKPEGFAKALSSCFSSNPDPPLSEVNDRETQKEMRHNAIRMAFNEDVSTAFKGNYQGSSDMELLEFAGCVQDTSKVTLSDIRDQEFKNDATQKALRKAIGCPADSTFDVLRLQRAVVFGADPQPGRELSVDEVKEVANAVSGCFARRRPNREAHDQLMRHFFCTNTRNDPYFFTAPDQTSKDLTQQVLNYAKCVLIQANGGTLPEKLPKELEQLIATPTASGLYTPHIQIQFQVQQSPLDKSGHFSTRFDTVKFAKFAKAKATAFGMTSS